MERSAWTDERLSDRFDEIDRRFDRLETRLDSLQARFDNRFDALGSELRAATLRTNLTMMVGFLGIIAAILARGA